MPTHRRPEQASEPKRRRGDSSARNLTPPTPEPATWWGTQLRLGPLPGRRSAALLQRNILIALGIVLFGVLATAGPAVVQNARQHTQTIGDRERITLASKPRDNPSIGLVYEGLNAAAPDAPCAGSYELINPETCSHGPDLAPPGLSVTKDVPAVTAAEPVPGTPHPERGIVPADSTVIADDGGISLVPSAPAIISDPVPGDAEYALGANGVACSGDGRSGNRVQILYLYEFGTPSRFPLYRGSIRAWAAGVDAVYDASAKETGGSRHVRYVTTVGCAVDVAEVQLATGSLDSFEHSIAALQKLGYNRTDRKYLLFADSHRYCAIGTFVADSRPGAGNRNNGGPSYGRVDSGCWSTVMAAHELTHMLGAIMSDAPNASKAGHCTDDYDLMCWRDSTRTTVRVVCPQREQEQRLDCNHDDYYNADAPKGSYLDQHWNVADSGFLLAGRQATSPAISTAAPPPSAGDTPARVPVAPAPATQQDVVLEARDVTSTSARITWTPAAEGIRYAVAVDGAVVGTTTAARISLVGLRPDTAYSVEVLLDDGRKPYAAATDVRTAPAARPADNTWFVLENALTGGAADVYAARTANGTPIVLNRSEGGSQQQWKLVPAAGGSYQLVSKATGKCVLPLSSNPAAGQPLVQSDCTPGDSSQRWTVVKTDHGFSLSSTVGGFVVGAGEQRFGGTRLLVLQHPDGSRHQSWAALPD